MKRIGYFLLALISIFSIREPVMGADGNDPLAALVQVLQESNETQFQLDVLKGITDALRGQRRTVMPAGWEAVETKLGQSSNAELRTLVQSLSLTFGSAKAQAELRKTVQNSSATTSERRAALESLVRVKPADLPPLLQSLLKVPALRDTAIRALAGYDDSNTPSAILEVYPNLNGSEKKDALNTLSSRIAFAKPLVAAVEHGSVSSKDLTAEIVRQLRAFKNDDLNAALQKVWGVTRESSADKQKEIERFKSIYRAGGSQPGDASRGRAVFAKTCQQCHTLFEVGGKVGPDLTGSNRSDLDYILLNVVDPNAVIPNEYRSSTLETKDDRVITGIVSKQDDKSVTIITPNETLVVPHNEIQSLRQGEISMMPEGLLNNLADQEVRDLIYYLSRPGQVPLPAGSDSEPSSNPAPK